VIIFSRGRWDCDGAHGHRLSSLRLSVVGLSVSCRVVRLLGCCVVGSGCWFPLVGSRLLVPTCWFPVVGSRLWFPLVLLGCRVVASPGKGARSSTPAGVPYSSRWQARQRAATGSGEEKTHPGGGAAASHRPPACAKACATGCAPHSHPTAPPRSAPSGPRACAGRHTRGPSPPSPARSPPCDASPPPRQGPEPPVPGARRPLSR
jgi:hypothetical protein